MKSRLAYILLAIFLGAFGIHNFYAGYIGRGIIQLILTLTGFGYIIVFVWVILDIILTTRDANGLQMS